MPIATESGYLPDWLQALLGQGQIGPSNAPAGLFSETAASPAPNVGLLSNLPQLANTQPPAGASAFQGGGVPPDLRGFQALAPASTDDTNPPATPSPPTDLRPPSSPPNATVIGTAASGAPEITAQQSPGFGDYLGKAANAVGSIYGAGGPGDALIAMGLANRTGGASVQALNAMTANRLNEAKLQAFKLQMANQAASANQTRKFFESYNSAPTTKEVDRISPEAIDAAVTQAQAGDPTAMRLLVNQTLGRDKFGTIDLPGGGKGVWDTHDPEKGLVQVLVPGQSPRPPTPEERKSFGLGSGAYSVSPGKAPEPISDADPLTKEIIGGLGKSRDQAIASTRALEAIKRQEDELNKGILTGSGAETITKGRALLGQLFGIQDEKVISSQKFDLASTAKAAELAKMLSALGHTTNLDIMVGKALAGGNRDDYEAAIRAAIDAQKQLATESINRHNSDIDRYQQLNPNAKSADFYRVEMPKTASDGGGQDNAAPPVPRQAPDGNWYIPDPKRPGKYLRLVQ